MREKKGKEKAAKGKASAFNFAPMGQGISGMMTKCCAGRGGFPDCATVMKGIMEQMNKRECTPDNDAAGFQGRKK